MKKLFLLFTVCVIALSLASCGASLKKYKVTEGGEVVFSVQGEEITAVPNNGYRFVRWSDGSEEHAREYGEFKWGKVTAEFEPIYVVLRNGEEETKISLADLAESDLEDILPAAEGVYSVNYVSDEVCELFGFDDGRDLLAQIKDRYLTFGISDTEDIVLDEKLYFYRAGEGGSVAKLNSVVTATADNGYRFSSWSDGYEEPERDCAEIIEGDVTAEFEPIKLILRDGNKKTEITLDELAKGNVASFLPNDGEGVYASSYTSEYVCDILDIDRKIDALAAIKALYLDEGITEAEDMVLYARYIFYVAGEGGSVTVTEDGVIATPDNGYRFSSWSDGKENAGRSDYFYSSEELFEAEFEHINVNRYVDGELYSSVSVSEFCEMSDKEIAVSPRGRMFHGWQLVNVSELFGSSENIVEQIKSAYADGKIRGEDDISLVAELTDRNLLDYYQYKTIAHALGGALWIGDGDTYLNTFEVFNYHYNKGQRFFEVDLSLTMEGKVVAAHCYDEPLYYDEFMASKGPGYTPMDLGDVVELMIEYPEIRMDLDILSVYRSAYEGSAEEKLTAFYELLEYEITSRSVENTELYEDIYDRLVLEIFFDAPLESVMFDMARSEKYGFKHFMFSGVGDKETPMGTLLDNLEAVCIWCVENGVEMMSTKIVDEEFIAMTDKYDIYTFAYTYNSEEDILELLEIGVDCVFTDFVYLD